MTRRLLILLPLLACLHADSQHDVVNLITAASSGLSSGKPEVFMEAFDPAMPGYEKLRDTITALVTGSDIECSIEVTRNEGDDTSRDVELDWILRVDRRPAGNGGAHREETVKCTLRKIGKKWRIVAFDAKNLFAPVKP